MNGSALRLYPGPSWLLPLPVPTADSPRCPLSPAPPPRPPPGQRREGPGGGLAQPYPRLHRAPRRRARAAHAQRAGPAAAGGRARVCIRVAAVPIVWGRGPGLGGAAPEGPCPPAAPLAQALVSDPQRLFPPLPPGRCWGARGAPPPPGGRAGGRAHRRPSGGPGRPLPVPLVAGADGSRQGATSGGAGGSGGPQATPVSSQPPPGVPAGARGCGRFGAVLFPGAWRQRRCPAGQAAPGRLAVGRALPVCLPPLPPPPPAGRNVSGTPVPSASAGSSWGGVAETAPACDGHSACPSNLNIFNDAEFSLCHLVTMLCLFFLQWTAVRRGDKWSLWQLRCWKL